MSKLELSQNHLFGEYPRLTQKWSIFRRQQAIRDKLEEAGLKMKGPSNTAKGPRTWANGKEEAEEANCLLKVGDLTYLVRGSELK